MVTDEMKKELLDAGIGFDGILDRLPGREDLICKLLGKFLNEKCYEGLEQAMKEHDCEAAFANAHTLKGITANLEMTRLNTATCILVEKLRAKQMEGTDRDFAEVKKEYEIVVNIIKKLILSE